MTAPVPTVEVAFGSTWQTEPASITWTDITGYVMSQQPISTVRGATSIGGEADTGQCDLTLWDADRRFDPLHTAGPYFGDLLPGVPIRVTGFVDAFTDDLDWGVDDLDWDVDELIWGGGGGSGVSIWYGTVARWPQRSDRGNRQATVPTTEYDGFDKLSRAKIPRSVIEKEILADSPRAYWPLRETSGTVMQDLSVNGRNGVYTVGATDSAGTIKTGCEHPALTLDSDDHAQVAVTLLVSTHALGALVDVSAVDSFVDGDQIVLAEYGTGDARIWSTSYRWGIEIVDAAAKTARIFVSGTLTAWSGYGYSATFDYSEPRYLASRFTVLSSMAHYVDGIASVGTTNPAATGYVPSGFRAFGTKNNTDGFKGSVASLMWSDPTAVTAARVAAYSAAALAPWDGHLTGQRVANILNEVGWPLGLRALEYGKTILGPATFQPGDNTLEYLRLVAASEDSRLFVTADGKIRFTDRYFPYLETTALTSQFTFSDTGTGRGYAEFDLDLDDELLVNVARFTRRGGTEQVVTDDTSVAAHGEAELQRTNLLHGTDAEVRSLAEWTVATRSTPLPRVPKIRIPLHKYSAADQAAVLGLELGYRVTCARTPQGVGSAITLDFLVDGIKHDVTATEWWVELYVSPVPQDTVELFLLDVSDLDSLAVLAY